MSQSIDIIVQCVDKATSVLKTIGGNITQVGTKAKEASKSLSEFSEKNSKGLSALAIASGGVLATLGFGMKRAVEESNKFENAMLGLKSIVQGTGNDFGQAQKFLDKFTKDGLVPMSDAATSLKNLLSRGFSLDEASVMMDRFKDSAAFGRQASLGLGEAVRSATEGIKNENSILVDNAGVTKNVSKMWEDYARQHRMSVQDMTLAQKRQAEYNGIIKETGHQIGDAAKLSATFSGQSAMLDTQITKLYKSIGDGLKPVLAELMAQVIPIIAKITDWTTKHPKLTVTIILSTAAIAGLTLALTTIGIIIPGLVAGIGTVSTVLAFLRTTILTSVIPAVQAFFVAIGPVGWVIMGIGAIIGAFALAWHNNFLGIRDITARVLTWISQNMVKLAPYIEGLIRGILNLANWGIKAINWVTGSSIKTIDDIAGKSKIATAGVITLTSMGADYVRDKWVNTSTDVQDGLNGVSNAAGGVVPKAKQAEDALDALGKKGKGASEKMKELKEKAQEAMKEIIDKTKDGKKAIDDVREAIKKKTEEWKNYKTEGVKALREIALEIQKVAAEAGKINLDFKANKEQKLGERMVGVNADIASTQKDLSTETDGAKQIELQKKLNDLYAEKAYIEANATQEAIQQAQAYASLSESQKIVADLEKEKSKALEENKAKMDALIEKQMVLNAQANQKSLEDQKIFTSIKDGIVSASIEDEHGKRVELHDQEAINLAFDVQAKQNAMKTEMDDLNLQLQSKLEAQTKNINLTTELYTKFNKFLKDDTKKTALEMTADLAAVNKALQETIALRAQAGMKSAPAVDGARANGGSVKKDGTYLVGERGPELFSPGTSGTITPNDKLATSVVIDMGGVTIYDRADADYFIQEIARRMQLGKLGIS